MLTKKIIEKNNKKSNVKIITKKRRKLVRKNEI